MAEGILCMTTIAIYYLEECPTLSCIHNYFQPAKSYLPLTL